MLITAICPRCESRYQVDEGLRGKRMRCPNPLCRTVFEVGAEPGKPEEAVKPAATPPAEPAKPPATGSVTEMVPVLSAELAEAPPVVKPPVVKPPPVRPPAAPPPVVKPPVVKPSPPPPTPVEPPIDFPDDFPGDDADSTPIAAEGPREIGPGTWEAPPVRGVGVEPSPMGEAPPLDGAAEPPPVPVAPPVPAAHGSRWRPLAVIAGMAVLLVGTAIVGWRVVEGTRAGNETERFKKAQELYDQGDYSQAQTVLQKLVADFPASADARKYRFLSELSSVRGEVEGARETTELKAAFEHVLQFVSFNQNESLLKDRHPDVWQMLHLLAKRLTVDAEKQHDGTALELARRAWSEADKKFQPPANVSGPETGQKLTRDFDRVAQVLSVHQDRQKAIAEIRDHVAHPSAAAVQQARALASRAGLTEDAEVKALLAELVDAHRSAVKYEAASTDSSVEVAAEDALSGILVIPTLAKAKAGSKHSPVALALARGVLYSLDAETGTFRWARRVGVDTTLLPLRVPADPITPELVLVVSSDSRSVSALIAETGTVVWRQGLAAPCTGQPVLVGRSLLVPTLSGRVDEIEVSAGRLLGTYDLGQRLTVGGVRQEGTSLVYFPGDDFSVYVLDVAKRTCAGVLYSNHPAGSLRGPPIILPGKKATGDKGPSGWLLLCQAKGSDAVEMRTFELPITDPDQPAKGPVVQVPGSASFPPYHDAEKLAIATDAGLLSLWGIRQKGNRDDPLLFALLGDPYSIAGGKGPGLAQVVHADALGYWVLAGGGLHRLESVFRPESGPGLRTVWAKPQLGTPLHAAQHFPGTDGRSALIATTLALDRPACLCASVDAASGELRWQQQLGCVAIHPPLAAGGHVLFRDATGLCLLDPAAYADQAGKPWHVIDELPIQEPLAGDDSVLLFASSEGFVQLAWSHKAATKLRVRQVPPKGPGASKTVDLPAPLAGTPALGNSFLVCLLADGRTARIELTGEGGLVIGPVWRRKETDEKSTGAIVALGANDFVITDGSRGIDILTWSDPKTFERRTGPTLSHRVVAPPAIIPVAAAGPQLAVADASDTVTLFDRDLKLLRKWKMPGRITRGPEARGGGIVCLVDGKRVIGIAPDRDDPWEYTMVSDLVGVPHLVDGALVAADVSGRFVAIDAQTGSPRGLGYTLKANVAPDATPVPFGPGRVLVPLNDGTLLLLPLDKLR